jgi:hypothetical protein
VPREDEEGLFIIYSGQSKNGSKTSYKRVEMMEYSKVDTLDLYNNFNSLDRNPIILKTESDATVASKPKLKNLDYTVDDFEKWSQSDCNAYTKDETATAYTFENDESITLKSKNEHNACIFQKVIINSNDIYTVDLDYEPYKKGENFLYVDFGKDFGYQKFLLDKKGHLNQDIIPPTGATNMLFVLYSGQTRSGEISMNYKAIKLQSYPKFHNLNSLVDHKDIKSSPTIEETKKIANHNYKLRVKTDGNNPFVLVMNDSYHAGWELLNTEKKGILAEHFMTNGYSNGWYLEPSNVCKDNTGCQLDSDGNYIIDLEADFALQRRFKTGAIVTVLSLGVVFILSVSSIFFHWYRKKKSSDYRVSDIN